MLWESVNAQVDQEMKEKILAREFYSQKCDACGETIQVMYTFLYHDMEHNYMVYIVPDSDPERQAEAISQMQEMFTTAPDGEPGNMMAEISETYKTRIVLNYNELIEKIKIFDNELDDRLVEAMKVISLGKMSESINDKTLTGIYYDDAAAGYPALIVVFDNDEAASIKFDTDLYESLQNNLLHLFDAHTPKGYSIVNYSWALEVLETTKPG